MNASEVKEGGRYVVRWGNIEPVVTVVGITYVSEYVKDSEGKTRGVGSPRYTVRREEDGHTKKLKFKDFIRACVPTVTIVSMIPASGDGDRRNLYLKGRCPMKAKIAGDPWMYQGNVVTILEWNGCLVRVYDVRQRTQFLVDPEKLTPATMMAKVKMSKLTGDTAEVRKRQLMEVRIASRIVEDACKAGYTISVDNGGDDDEYSGTDPIRIVHEMFATDQDNLHLSGDGLPRGVVVLVYGNSGYDVLSDYSVVLEPLLKGAIELAEKLEPK